MLFILSLVRHPSQVIYFIERCIYRINAVLLAWLFVLHSF